MRALLIATYCLFLSGLLCAQGQLTLRADSSRLLIGSQLGVDIELTNAGDFSPLTVQIDGLDTLPEIEIVGVAEWERSDNRLRTRLRLTAFDTGYFLLPPVSVSGTIADETVTIHGQRLPLEVYSTPLDTTGVKPIKPIVEEPLLWSDFKFILTGLSVLALIILLVWLLKKIRSSADETEPYVPPREAHFVALDKLERLEREGLWQEGKVKEYYVRLGDILREYIENRWQRPALEMTTGELLLDFDGNPALKPFAVEAAVFFPLADLVKFARAMPGEQAHRDWFAWCKRLVETTAHREEETDSKDAKKDGV